VSDIRGAAEDNNRGGASSALGGVVFFGVGLGDSNPP